MQIQDKVAVVTGSARGIGKGIAEALVNRGAKVVISDILDLGASVADELNQRMGHKVAVFEQCDVSDASNIQALLDRALSEFGALDIMVNNAGVAGTLLWNDSDPQSISRTIDINLKAPIEGTRLAARHMMASGRPGCVVNVASIAAFHALEFSPVYAASKAGLVTFTASCGTMANSDPRIRVNAIAQGYVETNIVNDNIPDVLNKILRASGEIPMERVVDGAIRCIEDETLAGDTIRIQAGVPNVVHDGPKAAPLGFIDAVKMEIAAGAQKAAL
ncbi:hypothetical protein IWW50_000678 [Coemansia erecta]|nr:hypothetical protein IWW50_000678 [Coemansia erecta]